MNTTRKYYVARKFYRASNPEKAFMTLIYSYPSKNARDNAVEAEHDVMYHTVSAGSYTPDNYNPVSSIGRNATITDVDMCVTVPVTRDESRKMCPHGYYKNGEHRCYGFYCW